MRELLKGLIAFSGLTAFYFSLTSLIELSHPACPQGTVLILKPPFPPYGKGVAYLAAAPSLEQFSDMVGDPQRSSYTVCENGTLLGPAHSVHIDIITRGKGRFSHWTESGFIFSASDNSDPNINGKKYSVALQPGKAH